MTAPCEICGAEFVVLYPSRPGRTCSRSCRNRLAWRDNPGRNPGGPSAQPRVIRECEWCGKPVKWAERPSAQARRRFCSRTCGGRAKSRGGTTIKKDGRCYVRLRDGGWQLYSRCLMEAELGRELTYNEVVHHRNGDKTDDRLENLEVMQRSEHTRMHSLEFWSILRSQGRT